jgi:hypothetical protein
MGPCVPIDKGTDNAGNSKANHQFMTGSQQIHICSGKLTSYPRDQTKYIIQLLHFAHLLTGMYSMISAHALPSRMSLPDATAAVDAVVLPRTFVSATNLTTFLQQSAQ